VKNAAKLVLFLCISFIGLLLISGLISLLQGWTNEALLFPPEYSAETDHIEGSDAANENSQGSPAKTRAFSGIPITYLESSVTAAFYLVILLGLNYAARRRIVFPAAFAVIFVFIILLSGAAFFGMESLEKMGVNISIKKPLAEAAKPGFILNSGAMSGYQTAFLENPQKPDGAAVIIIEGQKFNYQSQGVPVNRNRLPIFAEKRGIFYNIARDIEHSSRFFSAWFNSGLWFYGVYAGSLAAFLLSLGCLVNISFWSLANLFFGALAFRGALTLENFLNQNNIHDMLSSFAGNLIHPSLINPLIFSSLSVLILLYSGLVYLARGRIGDG